jgi:hypothetical protein
MACKMIKKGILGAALGAGALALLFGTAAPSYVKTAFHRVRNTAKSNVSVEFEIDRARQLLADLEPAIRENVQNLARTEETVATLKTHLAKDRAEMEKVGKEVVALHDALKGRTKLASNRSTTYSTEEMQADLANKFTHYKQLKLIVKEKEAVLAAKEKEVQAGHDLLKNIHDQKAALLTKIEEIEARHKAIEASKSYNEFNFDETPLAQVKAAVAELESRLNTEAREVELLNKYGEKGGSVFTSDPSRDVTKEVEAEFNCQDGASCTADEAGSKSSL